VPCLSLQFENGFQESAVPESGGGGKRAFDFPETQLRFGLTDTSEFRFTVPDYYRSSGAGMPTGAGDTGSRRQTRAWPVKGLRSLGSRLRHPA
jgi:hypothetical protein